MQEACTVVGIWLMLTATGIADDNADEMKRLQGRFERTYANAAGTTFRVVKDVTGDQSVVTSYDDVGNVIEAYLDIQDRKTRPRASVFVLQSDRDRRSSKGAVEFATRSYIYRIDGDMIGEAWGLLDGDDSPPRMLYWRRVKVD